MDILYCKKCLIPNTKPYANFTDSVCSACISYRLKNQGTKKIDWKKRLNEFEKIINWTRKQKSPYYDVMVPVSGGKDSIAQVNFLLKYKLRILAVCIDYGIRTKIGEENLKIITKMGANLIKYTPESKIHRRLIRIGLEKYGDPDLLSHTLMLGYPMRIGIIFKIPLLFMGENSAFEYGGLKRLSKNKYMTKEYFNHYVANKMVSAKSIVKDFNIPYKNLLKYDFPDELEKSKKVKAVFSSYFFPWSSDDNFNIAKKYGFKSLKKQREGTYRTNTGIDELINRLHHYLKLLKFGYGRGTDHASEDIRSGKLSRNQAKRLVRKYDTQVLGNYYINSICKFLGYKPSDFLKIVEKYRNTQIWKKSKNGKWYIPNHLK